jgi:hypothetical protein
VPRARADEAPGRVATLRDAVVGSQAVETASSPRLSLQKCKEVVSFATPSAQPVKN